MLDIVSSRGSIHMFVDEWYVIVRNNFVCYAKASCDVFTQEIWHICSKGFLHGDYFNLFGKAFCDCDDLNIAMCRLMNIPY